MSGVPTVSIVLSEHLTRVDLEASLSVAVVSLRKGKINLVVDCRRMTRYDADARQYFVDWNRRWATHVNCVAIVLTNPIWHLVVAAMALASGQRMKAFGSISEAAEWISDSERTAAVRLPEQR
jgi:hypothetical protein